MTTAFFGLPVLLNQTKEQSLNKEKTDLMGYPMGCETINHSTTFIVFSHQLPTKQYCIHTFRNQAFQC